MVGNHHLECHHLGSQETPFVKTGSVVFTFSFVCIYVHFKKYLQSEIHDLRSGETFPRKKKFVFFPKDLANGVP